MKKEVGTKMKLHLPRDPLDDTPLGEAQDTGKEGDSKNEEREKENPSRRYRKVGIFKGALQFIKNHLEDLWANQEKHIRHNDKNETDYDGVSISNDILLEAE